MRNTAVIKSLLLLGALILPCMASATAEDGPLFVNNEITAVDPRFPAVTYPPGYVLDDTVPWKTQVIQFDPNRTFTPEEKAKIIESELQLTGGSRSELDSIDGLEELEINQGTIPDISTPAAQILDDMFGPTSLLDLSREGINICPLNQQYILNREESRSSSFGNNVFGAEYLMRSYLKVRNVPLGKEFNSLAEASMHARAFGVRMEVIRAIATWNTSPTTAGGSAEIRVMGAVAWSASLEAARTRAYSLNRHFFRSEKVFMVGPVPIRVTASISGQAGLEVTGTGGGNGIALNATPKGSVNATASAGVSVIIASFGISGELRLIDVSFPATTTATVSSNQLQWGLKFDRRIATLNGRISLYATVRFIFFRQRWDLTIASWDGWSRNETLVNVSSTLPLTTATASLSEP